MSGRSLRHAPSAKQVILAVVLLVNSVVEVTGSIPTYQWKDPTSGEAVTCQKCQPGTYVTSHCTQDTPTVCQPCPDLHYTEFWNYVERCRYCNVFCDEREVEAQPCSATHNRQCQCQPGFYLDFEFCVEHSECTPGFGVLTLGTEHKDTQCQKCPPGTFSNTSSRTEPCQPHRDCRAEGLEVNVEGDQHHDTLCTSCQVYDAQGTQEDCEQAIFDFMVSRMSPRKLKRLVRRLSDSENRRQPRRQQLNRNSLRKLHTFLNTQRDNPGQNPVDTLLQLLGQAHLNKLEKDIRKKFFKLDQ
ncbi:tumor necrosis factor receptor superfamily member 6B [Lissotriton helveticus]